MQHAILVIGMHRSGTSALSGMLNILGVYQGRDLLPSSKTNPKGFFENKNILNFNERVLSEHGSHWDDVFFSDKALLIDKFSEELKTVISEEFGAAQCFSIKDPRICLLFPIYEKVLTEMGISIHPIIIYRSPLETAESLSERDGFSLEKGLILWMDHFLLSEKYTRPFPRIFVSFEQILEAPHFLISAIEENWRLPIELDQDKQAQLDAFLQAGLKHINISLDHAPPNLPHSMRELIRLLRDPDEITGHPDALDEIREIYLKEKAFFFLREFKDSLKEVDLYRYAQFYIDTGKGFSEKQSQRIPNPEEKESLELDLTQYPGASSIRFDPLNQPVAVSIISATFRLKNNAWVEAKVKPLNLSYFSDEIDYFYHEDPQYYLPLPNLASEAQRLVIRLSYQKRGGREVAPIVCAMLRQRLQTQRKALIRNILHIEQKWKKRSQAMRQEAEKSLASERLARTKTEQELNMVQSRSDQLQNENERIKTELENLYNSKTWRLTRPLRQFISWLK